MFSIKIEPLIIFKVLRLRTHKLTMFCSAHFLSPFFLIIVLVFGSSWRRHSESQKIIRIQKLIRTHDIPGSWTGATLEKYLSSVIHWFTFPRIALYCITNFHIVPHGFGFLFQTIFPVVSAVFCYIPIRIPQELLIAFSGHRQIDWFQEFCFDIDIICSYYIINFPIVPGGSPNSFCGFFYSPTKTPQQFLMVLSGHTQIDCQWFQYIMYNSLQICLVYYEAIQNNAYRNT